MPGLEIDGTTLELNEDGFLRDPELWSDAVARALAAAQGISELTPEHFKVVRYLRQHWLDHELAPMVRKLCKETGVTLKRIYELFPTGPAKGACKVAGMPNANGCV